MRFFTTVVALALAAAVSAQTTTATSTESTTVEASSTSTSLSPTASCLAACGESDICCRAACVNVPCPNEAAVNATTECAGQCVQGNGTEEETAAYASCQASCVSSYFLTATTGSPAATGSAGSASTTGSFDFNAASSTASRTATGTGSSASSTGNAAVENRVALAGVGLFGLIVAGLAL